MSRIVLLSAAAAILLVIAYAYGGRGSGATPLDGTTAYVTVVHGCMCSAPAFGLVEVAAAPPAGVRLLDAEVTSGSQVFTMALDTEQKMTNCLLEGVADGYTGGDFIHTSAGILMGNPTPDSLHLRLHFQQDGDEGWATVPITDVCSAES